MDAVKFFKEKKRMANDCKNSCDDCPLGALQRKSDMSCKLFEMNSPEEAIAIVEKWSKEHPQKTYKDDFLEKFPNTQIDEFKVPRVHWCEVYNDGACRYKSTGGMHLCCDCWNEPMED